MKITKYIIAFLMLLSSAAATTRYVSQNGGAFAGGSACNGQTAITPAMWNATTIAPGDSTFVCGTITAAAGTNVLVLRSSGTSGNPITITFDSGATMTAPYWNVAGAINVVGQSWVVVDGGANGTIQATAAGTNLANNCTTGGDVSVCNGKGIYFENVSNSEVKNLTVANMYVHVCNTITPPFSSCTDNNNGQLGAGIYWLSGSNVTIDHNTVHDAYSCIFYTYGGGSFSNVNIHHNTTTNCNWSIVTGSGGAGDRLTNYQVNNNTLSGWDNWNTNNNANHHDGVFVFTQAANQVITNPVVNANKINSPLTTMTGNIFFQDHNAGNDQIVGAMISNNIIFNPTSNITGCPGNAYITAGATSSIIVNNTIIASRPGTCTGSSGGGNTGIVVLTAGTVFYNNIIKNCYFGLLTNPGSVITASDHNNIVNCTEFGWQESKPDNVTLASWQGSGLDLHSLAVDPNLDAATYAPTTGSPMIGAGLNLTANYCGTYPFLCRDFNGQARPSSGAWDVGAVQFGSAGGTGGSGGGGTGGGGSPTLPSPPTGLTGVVR